MLQGSCRAVLCAVPLQANHLLPPLRQSPPADSSSSAEANGGAASSSAAAAADVGVDEDTLARCVGYFLRTCPGLSKVTIGELLGDPDKFFLKVGSGAAVERYCAGLLFCVASGSVCGERGGWTGRRGLQEVFFWSTHVGVLPSHPCKTTNTCLS